MAAERNSDEQQQLLSGLRVAFSGRLASLSRASATQIVLQRGGVVSGTVTRATNVLVIGRRRWPLRKNGRPSLKLTRVEALRRAGHVVEVMTEEDFLRRSGLLPSEETLGLHPLPVLAHSIGVEQSTVNSWVRWGFLAPAEIRAGVSLFDYAGVAAARSLAELLVAGHAPRRIARSLIRIRQFLPSDFPTAEVVRRLTVSGGRLALPTDDGRWIEPNGQFLFDFADENSVASVRMSNSLEDASLYEEAVERERQGDFDSAAELYQRLLQTGPDADLCLNLGNVLYAMGRIQAAAERFRQAVEIDPTLAEAWNNLGNCLAETDDPDGAARAFRRAIASEPSFVLAWENLGSLLDDVGEHAGAAHAYRQALAIEPDNAEAHRALAAVLEDAGDPSAAQRHWNEYLAREPNGEWAGYARSRLRTGNGA